MQFKLAVLSALSSALLAAAQDTVVQVGATATTPNGGYFQFIPPTFNATKGSVITFNFTGVPGNHTITQSSFANPCTSISGGFDSGYVYVPGPITNYPIWNLTITDDTTPIWFFCKQLLPTPHCPAGMVGAINAPATGNTFQAFQNTAKSYTGTINQAEGGFVGSGASASAAPAPITEGAQYYTAPASTATSTSGGGSSSGNGALGLSASSLLLTTSGALLGGFLILA